ncbi:hypothetical protein SCRM01_158c [Synechococcus phage S-CRM01]|uniref:hypothetical protein n=1 Tax=Synechococcus phage S-CRM01 TaxID=1026955 RepID=UPI000209E3EF|nr:hypothetical protein SCRM01_158c [Synechococcus phage S-CRM01]AEC53104.1 hypothetical protein SCRM01_158c [Synechococcus phage S-CRM01]
METEVVTPVKPEKRIFSMEVTYEYKHDKETPAYTSWFYHWVETNTLNRAVVATKKYFNEMVSSTGWTSKVKIISIDEMKNDKSKPETQVVSDVDLPAARTKSTGTARKSQTAKKTTTKKTTATKVKTTTPRKPRTPKATTTSKLPL